MDQRFFTVFTLVIQWFRPRYNVQLQFLEFQIKMLRSRIDAERVVPTAEEKFELLRLGEMLGHDVKELMHVVRPETYQRWRRIRAKGHIFKKLGRPPIAQAIRNLVCRMAQENLKWGYKRIVGELKKLGIRIGTTTVRDICKEMGIYPEPKKSKKKPPIPWTQFVHAHMDSLIAIDFFTKRVYTWYGVFDAYVLVFIHLGTRRVYHSPATYHPNEEWVMQQARNATMWMEDEGIDARFLILDGDKKFTRHFKEFWKDCSIRCIRIPPESPKANAFAETYIGKYKHACLNNFCCFSLNQLDYIGREWLTYYHEQRPHQGKDIGNVVLNPEFTPTNKGRIHRKERLGGILAWYEREAA